MNDSLKQLLQILEPKILNIQKNRLEVKTLNEVYHTILEIKETGKANYLNILDYYDQNFIIRTLKIKGDKKLVNEYQKSFYVLKNKNNYLKELPQYNEALTILKKIYDYLIQLYNEISEEYLTKKTNLENQELYNKYYHLLNKNNILIDNPLEFLSCLNLISLSNYDKLNILILVNKCNIKNFTTNDILLTNDITLSDITNLLKKYQDYLQDNKTFKPNLELDTKYLFLEQGLPILNIKKQYLLNKINSLYQTKKYDNLIKDYKDFQEIQDLEKEFSKQQQSFSLKDKLLFLKVNNKSTIKKYLESCNPKYKDCLYKNLLDIENNQELIYPDYKYKNYYIYIKDEFIIKTIYLYLENGQILIIGVLDVNDKIENFMNSYDWLLKTTLNNLDKFTIKERDDLLKNIKLEDLVLTIDLNTLDMKVEEI